MSDAKTYDVVICGAGLAGLTLARQLKGRMSDLSVLVVDRLRRPLDEAAFKVGESTLILGAAYLMHVARLHDYLAARHVQKLGLRFFFGADGAPIQERAELGRSTWLPFVTEWQLDRGAFENDVRQLIVDEGTDLVEGVEIKDVHLHPGELHEVCFVPIEGGEEQRVRARWVIDATGRRRLLQRKLGLARQVDAPCSSSWFRVDAKIDVEDLVPRTAKGADEWFARVPGNHPTDPTYGRANSTIHLTGDGYWVWIIPLREGRTSVGIVATERRHPIESFNTLERHFEWLKQHEPQLHGLVEGKRILDFGTMRRYTYGTQRFLSADRWGATGEAAVFVDPLYSLGTDTIGYGNTVLTELIALDREGKMTPELCERFEKEMHSLFETLNVGLRAAYSLMGDSVLGASTTLWHLAFGATTMRPMYANRLFVPGFARDPAMLNAPEEGGYFALADLHGVVSRLFVEWSERKRLKPRQWKWIDYFEIPFLKGLTKHAGEKVSPVVQWRRDGATAEALAQAFFLLALEDTAPEKLAKVQETPWLNSWALTLDDTRWEPEGLFTPKSPPQDVRAVQQQLKTLFCW